MENPNQSQNHGRDPQLWEIAKRRASFKTHLATYIVVNCFLWAVWYFTSDQVNIRINKTPWPIWSTLGWGIGLLFHFLSAYVYPKENSVEREYDKLTRNKK